MNAKERKENSERILREQGILINEHLPMIETEEEAEFRTPEEIAERSAAAVLISQIAIDIAQDGDIAASRQFFSGHLKRLGLYGILTDDEKLILEAGSVPKEFAVNMTWRIEMCMPLFYACGFIEGDLDYPSEASDCTSIVKMIIECKDRDDLMSHIKMKPSEDILDRADLIYRMDWACVEARIRSAPKFLDKLLKKNSRNISGSLDHEVVVEQHKGYNWIIGAYGSEEWDNVSADT